MESLSTKQSSKPEASKTPIHRKKPTAFCSELLKWAKTLDTDTKMAILFVNRLQDFECDTENTGECILYDQLISELESSSDVVKLFSKVSIQNHNFHVVAKFMVDYVKAERASQ